MTAGIGEQPAPIAGMMAALAQIDDQVEIDRAARAEKDRRASSAQAAARRRRSARRRRARLACCAQNSRRPGEPISSPVSISTLQLKPSCAALGEHGVERGEVDRVLALVVGGAAAVDSARRSTTTRQGDRPCRHCASIAADDVAMAVAEHGRMQRGSRCARRAAPARRSGLSTTRCETEPRERRRDLVGEIGAQRGCALPRPDLGRNRDAAPQIGGKPPSSK